MATHALYRHTPSCCTAVGYCGWPADPAAREPRCWALFCSRHVVGVVDQTAHVRQYVCTPASTHLVLLGDGSGGQLGRRGCGLIGLHSSLPCRLPIGDEISLDSHHKARGGNYLCMRLVRVCRRDGRGDIVLARSRHLADSVGDPNVELTALLGDGERVCVGVMFLHNEYVDALLRVHTYVRKTSSGRTQVSAMKVCGQITGCTYLAAVSSVHLSGGHVALNHILVRLCVAGI